MMNRKNALLLFCTFLKPLSKKEVLEYRQKIIDDKIPWLQLIAIANSNYMIPLLYMALQKNCLYDDILDEQLKEYLYTIYTFNYERNKQILQQLDDLVSTLSPLGITPLLLKGSAVLCENDYDDLGARSLTDIDILIKEDALKNAFNALVANGYHFTREEDKRTLTKDFHHIEPISKEGYPSSVELHRTILGKGVSTYMLDYEQHMTKSTHKDFTDINILTPTYRLYHAFLHTELQDADYKFKRLALRHLFDFTVLVKKYEQEIDWKLLDQLVTKKECKEILEDYLYVVNQLFSLQTPLTTTTKRARKHYRMVCKEFELRNSWLGYFYPLSAQIPKLLQAYSYKKLQKIYSFNSYNGYIIAIFKHFYFHIKSKIF